jgi:hypothetical protein
VVVDLNDFKRQIKSKVPNRATEEKEPQLLNDEEKMTRDKSYISETVRKIRENLSNSPIKGYLKADESNSGTAYPTMRSTNATLTAI